MKQGKGAGNRAGKKAGEKPGTVRVNSRSRALPSKLIGWRRVESVQRISAKEGRTLEARLREAVSE